MKKTVEEKHKGRNERKPRLEVVSRRRLLLRVALVLAFGLYMTLWLLFVNPLAKLMPSESVGLARELWFAVGTNILSAVAVYAIFELTLWNTKAEEDDEDRTMLVQQISKSNAARFKQLEATLEELRDDLRKKRRKG